jgi:hypothetical protein
MRAALTPLVFRTAADAIAGSGFSRPFSLKASLKGIYRLDCHFSGGINICNGRLELEKILPNTLFVCFGSRFIAHIGQDNGDRTPRHYFWHAPLVRQSFQNAHGEKRPRGGLKVLSGRFSLGTFPGLKARLRKACVAADSLGRTE